MFILTQDELQLLTGYRRASRQVKWLTKNGYAFTTNANGMPCVSRQAAEAKLSGQSQQRQPATPNFGALA
ncbi:DUF4224 domain-containing protein [Jeongeupia sp. USM3]|uniref:DUF4224 domain-containing protein n=1 Tax=Jeongeupia sp. USM3 TaxID=1906741 RepID=UPI00089DE894|nr:DUF4224 domain-containing protein [Jeongeupia sp. USM3]AOY00136.1 hypothetical protein BJP62_06520 [Jeongeupia sp. USM3]